MRSSLPRADATRWSGSAWLLARREPGEPALAPGGTLSGSQAGARILYRVNRDPARPLALAGRLYVPLHRSAGAEVAAGVDWQPAAGLPVHILAERREALGGEGRSAFALTLYGGFSRRLPHGLRGRRLRPGRRGRYPLARPVRRRFGAARGAGRAGRNRRRRLGCGPAGRGAARRRPAGLGPHPRRSERIAPLRRLAFPRRRRRGTGFGARAHPSPPTFEPGRLPRAVDPR